MSNIITYEVVHSYHKDEKIYLECIKHNGNDAEDFVQEVPSKFEVCWGCNGKGKHVNPSVDGNGLTARDFDEDPDFAYDYFHGMYDVVCYECGGKRVVVVFDQDAVDRKAKTDKAFGDIISAYYEYSDAEASYEMAIAAERRMGA